MKRILLVLPLLAACAPTPEPIQDYNAPYLGGKYDKAPVTSPRPKPRPTPWCVMFPWLCDDRDDPREPPKGCIWFCGPKEPPTPPEEPPVTPEPKVKGNNGLGNGDQRAPGNSLDHNKAENQKGNPGHKSGKPQNSN